MKKTSHATHYITYNVAQGCGTNIRVTVIKGGGEGGARYRRREGVQEQRRRVPANCTGIGGSRNVWFLKLRNIRNNTSVHQWKVG